MTQWRNAARHQKMYLVLFLEFPSPDHSYVAPFVIIGVQETSKLKGVTV